MGDAGKVRITGESEYALLFRNIIGEYMDTKENDIENLRKGLHTAFIDGTYNSNLAYKPELNKIAAR